MLKTRDWQITACRPNLVATCFFKLNFTGTQPPPFVRFHIVCGCFQAIIAIWVLVIRIIVQSLRPKVFIIWPFTEKVCLHLTKPPSEGVTVITIFRMKKKKNRKTKVWRGLTGQGLTILIIQSKICWIPKVLLLLQLIQRLIVNHVCLKWV